MKKIISTMFVFVLSLSLAGAVMAASAKPPASICFTSPEHPEKVFALVIKATGSITMSGGSVKFYSIQGFYYDPDNDMAAVAGSGYMDGTVFHFSLHATYTWHYAAGSIQIDATWDVVANTGTMYSFWNSNNHQSWTLTKVSCNAL